MQAANQTVHADVGINPTMAMAMKVKPYHLALCGAEDGGMENTDEILVEMGWALPAAVNCEDCKRVAAGLRWEIRRGPDTGQPRLQLR